MYNPSERPKVLLVGPLPPPAFGVAQATRMMLDSETLAEHVALTHLDTTDAAGFADMGALSWHNVRLGIAHLFRLIRLLWRERPQVTLLTASQGRFALVRDGLFASLSRTFGARTAIYLRGSGYADLREREGWLAAAILRSILKHSSRVIVLGQGLVQMARAVCPACSVAVVPNGCTPSVPSSRVGTRDDSRPVLAYIGRLSHDKGVTDALDAAKRVALSNPEFELVLCGEWDSRAYEEQVKAHVAREGLGDVIKFPGPVHGQDKEDLLARAWVLLVPSHSEGQPWVILEAMSAGLPVVATDTGAIPETVSDGVSGFVVSVGDSEALATRIVTLLADDRLWKRMSKNAHERYLKHFTVERSHELLAEELLKVAGVR